jgi:hypothetical protein
LDRPGVDTAVATLVGFGAVSLISGFMVYGFSKLAVDVANDIHNELSRLNEKTADHTKLLASLANTAADTVPGSAGAGRSGVRNLSTYQPGERRCGPALFPGGCGGCVWRNGKGFPRPEAKPSRLISGSP